MRKIILASTSPRRKALLAFTGLPFAVEESNYEEDMTLPLPPKKLAIFLSRGKAEAVARRHKNAIVIGADTFVVVGRELMGKARTPAEARLMLRKLSGRKTSAITAFTVIDTKSGRRVSKAVESLVYFKKFTARDIEGYIRSGESLGKAGAYTVQGLGGVLIRKIEGDFPGIVGLPIYALSETLKKFGISVL